MRLVWKLIQMVLVSSVVVFSNSVLADNSILNDPRYKEIHSVEIIELAPDMKDLKEARFFASQGCDQSTNVLPFRNSFVDKIDVVNVALDKIINIGAKIWNIIKKSRPVVTVKGASANALPKGVKCWTDLEQWQAPRSNVYSVVYKNFFRMEVIRFDLRAIYTYGGRYQGKGRYITNAAVQYKNLKVAPGMFELDASVEVPEVVNLGTKENPVAGMQMNVNWTARGVNELQESVSFFIYGDGRPTEIHQ